jgi:hypothetical protein
MGQRDIDYYRKVAAEKAGVPVDELDQLDDGSADLVEVERTRAIAKEATEQEIEEANQEIGYSARLLVQATMPHSNPGPDVTEFKRSNGFVTISINGRKKYGLPYGTYPRLLLAWVTTEAVRTKSSELELGDSLAAFMAKLGLAKGGGPQGSVPRLRQHMQRLFTSTVSAEYKKAGEWQQAAFCPIEGACIFWDPQSPDQGSLWRSCISLNHRFYEEIVYRPVPIDMAALQALAKGRSPMAIDIYQWLTYRMSYLKKPTTIPWPALQLQFGCDFGCVRDFKKKFLRHLKQVLRLYPQARVEPTGAGLKLWPSPTHIPMRLIKGGRR